ncbi:MAG: hypothetical protein ACP5L4_01840 [Thermoplasmata archaeon]
MGFLDIVTSGILAIFSMFSQLIQYLASSPGNAIYIILTNWGISFEGYGIAIPIIFVLIVGVTGAVAYTIIEMAESTNEAMGVGDIENIGMGVSIVGIEIFQNQNIIHSTSLDELSYIFINLGNAIVNGILMLFHAIIQGFTTGFSGLIKGLENAIGIPFSYWSSNLNTNYLLPVVFVVILGIALLIGIAFIDAMGYEKGIGEGIADLSEIEL